jgi:iron complex outermembrane receptor protein
LLSKKIIQGFSSYINLCIRTENVFGYGKKKILLLIIFIFLLSLIKNTHGLELRLTIPIFEPLSKTSSTTLEGARIIIIDREEISKNINKSIHEIIERYSGIKSRSIYGSRSSGSKTTIDIRGMGAQAKSNVLLLVNGQKLNNIDMSEVDYPIFPLESIERIEILKGNSASVLYGDSAIGGTINIITSSEAKKNNKDKFSFKIGSFNTRELSLDRFTKIKNQSLKINFNYRETDGYRDENEQIQNNFTSELIHKSYLAKHFIAFNFNEQIMSTPGDRDQDQLYNDRRGSDTINDYINSLGGSLIYGGEKAISKKSKLLINSSLRFKNSYSDLQSSNYPSYSDTRLSNLQISPRIDYKTYVIKKNLSISYGIDLQIADYKSYRKKNDNAIALHEYDGAQRTISTFSQTKLFINESLTFGFGLRAQENKITIKDFLNTSAPDYAGWQAQHDKYSHSETNFIGNIGFRKKTSNFHTFYGRFGNGLRYPNIDDRIGGLGGTSLDLKTQKTLDLEFGNNFNFKKSNYDLSLYLIEGKNELSYDTDAFQNINVNSTRRFGVELDTINKLSNKINFKNNFTFAKAKYTSENQGTYATNFKSKDVPLVPQYSLDSTVTFNISDKEKINLSFKYQDDMRMESDDENFQDTKIPSYFITNINILKKIAMFQINFDVNNLLNTKYHNYAVASSSTNGTYNAYPEPGRNFSLNIETKF